MKLPKTVSEDGIQQRTVEGIADIPVPQVVKELVKVSKVLSQDRVGQRYGVQIIKTPGVSLAEKIVEAPVTQMQQVLNTSVQHDVNTLDVEKHIINQLTRHVETPLLQIVKKTFEVPELRFIDTADNTPVVAQKQIRMNRNVHKTIEIHQLPYTRASSTGARCDEDSRDPTGTDRGGNKRDPTVAARRENRDDPRDPDDTWPSNL